MYNKLSIPESEDQLFFAQLQGRFGYTYTRFGYTVEKPQPVFLPQSTVRSIKSCLRTDEMTKRDTNQLKDLESRLDSKIMKVLETNSKILDTMNPKNGKIGSDSDSD